MGRQRNRLLNEMLAILPEIYKSGVWRKYAETIIEYAGKFGGISKSAVLKRLRLEKHLIDKPALKEAIKTAGVNKVAAIATPQTDRAFADKITNMSKSAIETLSRELRAKADQGEICTSAVSTVSTCCAVPVKIKLKLDDELSFLFMKLKQKWGISNKEVMKRLLNQAVAVEFPEKKVSIKAMRTQTAKKVKSAIGSFAAAGALAGCVDPMTGEAITGDRHEHAEGARSVSAANTFVKPKKYINVYKQRATLSETGGRCSYPGCNKPAVNFHHADRWSITKNHDNIRPLCKEHHEFPHNGQLKTEADVLYRKCRQEALL